MDKCSFEDVLSSIPAYRDSFKSTKSNYNIVIVKDILAITYKAESGEYVISYNLITCQGKVISMDWLIDLPFTIPEPLRMEAKANANRPIAFHETVW